MHFKPISRLQFWKDEKHWPREGVIDGLRTVFIARAFNRVGQHIFGNGWTGVEGYAAVMDPLPSHQSMASDDMIRLVDAVLSDLHPEFKGRMPLPNLAGTFGSLGGLGGAQGLPALLAQAEPYQPFFDQDWDVAKAIFEAEIARRQPDIDRRAAVAEWLAVHINDEQNLRVILIDPRSAAYGWGPAHHWNARWQDLENRWSRGSYNYDAPFAPIDARAPGREFNIFAVEADLETLLGGGQQPPPIENDSEVETQSQLTQAAGASGRAAPDESKPAIALEALIELYPDGKIPPGSVRERDDALRARLAEKHPQLKISGRSITKAVGEFRRRQKIQSTG